MKNIALKYLNVCLQIKDFEFDLGEDAKLSRKYKKLKADKIIFEEEIKRCNSNIFNEAIDELNKKLDFYSTNMNDYGYYIYQSHTLKPQFLNCFGDTFYLFHGTDKENLKLNYDYSQIFLSTEYGYSYERGENIFHVELPKNLKLLDSHDENDLMFLLQLIDDEQFYDPYSCKYLSIERVSRMSDNWETIEYYFLDGIHGFDGIWIYEGGVKNLLLWSYEKIISIKKL